MPGPSSVTVNRTGAARQCGVSSATARSGASCARSRCRSGCAAPGRAGRDRASGCRPGRCGVSRPGDRRSWSSHSRRCTAAVRSRAAQKIALLGAGEQQHVVDHPRDPGDLGAAAAAPGGSPPAWAVSPASTSSWPAITVSGVRSSWEASATKSRWCAKATSEPVEHLVERVGQRPDLAGRRRRRCIRGAVRRRRRARRPAMRRAASPGGARQVGRDQDQRQTRARRRSGTSGRRCAARG